jgi:hypothetical protein
MNALDEKKDSDSFLGNKSNIYGYNENFFEVMEKENIVYENVEKTIDSNYISEETFASALINNSNIQGIHTSKINNKNDTNKMGVNSKEIEMENVVLCFFDQHAVSERIRLEYMEKIIHWYVLYYVYRLMKEKCDALYDEKKKKNKSKSTLLEE